MASIQQEITLLKDQITENDSVYNEALREQTAPLCSFQDNTRQKLDNVDTDVTEI